MQYVYLFHEDSEGSVFLKQITDVSASTAMHSVLPFPHMQ